MPHCPQPSAVVFSVMLNPIPRAHLGTQVETWLQVGFQVQVGEEPARDPREQLLSGHMEAHHETEDDQEAGVADQEGYTSQGQAAGVPGHPDDTGPEQQQAAWPACEADAPHLQRGSSSQSTSQGPGAPSLLKTSFPVLP